MQVVVSEPAAELIGERGGRLYVWLTRPRCCGGMTRLSSATSPPSEKQFRRVDSTGDFELYVPRGLTRLPDELHIELRRFPRRIESYWNGCAWVA
jgi:hypothetical protein